MLKYCNCYERDVEIDDFFPLRKLLLKIVYMKKFNVIIVVKYLIVLTYLTTQTRHIVLTIVLGQMVVVMAVFTIVPEQMIELTK